MSKVRVSRFQWRRVRRERAGLGHGLFVAPTSTIELRREGTNLVLGWFWFIIVGTHHGNLVEGFRFRFIEGLVVYFSPDTSFSTSRSKFTCTCLLTVY